MKKEIVWNIFFAFFEKLFFLHVWNQVKKKNGTIFFILYFFFI